MHVIYFYNILMIDINLYLFFPHKMTHDFIISDVYFIYKYVCYVTCELI